MPVDHIRYDILVQDALRGMVRDVLTDIVKKPLPGEHHFFITFATTADGVRLSDRLLAQYPEEMTIVLQHQFWDLKVSEHAFEVGLSFGGVAERLVIPFEAIKAFSDPSVQFTLQFETLAEDDEEDAETPETTPQAKTKRPARARPEQPAQKLPASSPAKAGAEDRLQPAAPQGVDKASDEKGGAEVVRLDRFRKK